MKVRQLSGASAPDREKTDFYPTPEWATDTLLNALPFRLPDPIWEPACGDGAICRVLERHAYQVFKATDLYPRGHGQSGVDFLMLRPVLNPNRGTIITNPPYRLAAEFADLALEYAQTVIMLCKLNFLAGQERRGWWKRTPLRTVYIHSRRVSFDKADQPGKGAGLLEYAWFHWEHGHEGPPAIAWL